jgi:hypothetical protein
VKAAIVVEAGKRPYTIISRSRFLRLTRFESRYLQPHSAPW